VTRNVLERSDWTTLQALPFPTPTMTAGPYSFVSGSAIETIHLSFSVPNQPEVRNDTLIWLKILTIQKRLKSAQLKQPLSRAVH
jgi:hypothetical protein